MNNIDFNIFQVDRPNIKPQKGKILIADPFLKDPYLGRSIVLLTEYGEDGAIGFVINKSTNLFPDEIIDDLLSFKGNLFVGGPVGADSLHFIHTLGDKIPDSVQISETLYWGGNFDVLKQLINNKQANFTQVRFFIGYSGWSSGQLEKELEEHSWLITSIDDEYIMSKNMDNIWKTTLSDLGTKYKTWSNFPEDPSHN